MALSEELPLYRDTYRLLNNIEVKAKGGSNPDSFISNNVFSPFDFGTTPFVRNFSFALNLRF